MSKGIVVQHKETGNRYAVSEENFNPKTEDKIRVLKRGESVRSFVSRPQPKKSESTKTSSAASLPEGNK